MTILDWISQEYIPQLLESFLSPQKRVSVYYLAVAATIALCWSFFVTRQGLLNSLKHIRFNLFSRNVWFSRSALGDYKILLANHALLILVAPLFVSKLVVATVLFFTLQDLIPAGGAILSNTSPLSVAIGYTFFLFLLDDFSRFATHFALHRIPALWAFHKTHHSAETLSPLTVYRTHPAEAIIFSFRSIAVQSISISLVVFLFGASVDLVSVYGVNAILFVFNVTGSNLRHSHIQIRYGHRLERFLISPAQHQIHHSLDPRHHDRNFGAALAVWDWMAGSLYIAQRDMKLEFGLTTNQTAKTHLLTNLYLAPFFEVLKSTRMRLSRRNPTHRSAKNHAA